MSLPTLHAHSDRIRPAADGPALRVLVVTESFLPQTNGVTASVCRVLEHLREAGHTAEVIAASGPDCYAGARVRTVPAAPLPGYPGFRVGLGSRRRIAAIMEDFRPDVVHLASPFMLGAAAARAARTLGVPTVAVYQTDLIGFARRYGLAAAVPALERQVQRIHCSVDRTLAPSTASLAQLAELDVPSVHRWGRGIDLERFSPRLRRPASAWLPASEGALPEEPVVLGYVGRLAKEKNLEHLAAIQDLPGTRLAIVGDGPLRPRLEQALDRATFLGERSGQELARIMASLDVFVHPGAEETFCQSAQEALASGVPVVGPASGGLLDRVRHGSTGLLYAPDDRAGLRGAVTALLDPATRRRMAEAARPSVEDRSWHVVNAELIRHYRAVVRESPLRTLPLCRAS
ncbi:glycosyltransferase family 4 protein [Brevibacterium album]|uniref:glycosyltransferase family 4 protein n=1 Tax=Brevibacterium album TaxID=417948 RepID=UPI00040BED7B|nr:glycosyltransferase family 1 protein [Brevibacterium album]